jgi:tetratricopeptide (TPR) repeat protein
MNWNDWVPRNCVLREGFDNWRRGHCHAALVFFELAVQQYPTSDEAWRGYGSVLWTLGRYAECLTAFRTAVELGYWNAMNWANVGLVCRDLHLWPQAENAFRVAIALDPNYEPAYNEWANVLVDQGRPEEALRLYETALSFDNSRAVVYHNQGVCLRLLHRVDEAIQSFRQAIGLDPTYHHTHRELERLGGRERFM